MTRLSSPEFGRSPSPSGYTQEHVLRSDEQVAVGTDGTGIDRSAISALLPQAPSGGENGPGSTP